MTRRIALPSLLTLLFLLARQPQAVGSPTQGLPASGFTLEARIGGALMSTGQGGPAPVATIHLGLRFADVAQFTVGLGISRNTPVPETETAAATATVQLTILPSLSLDLYKSTDRRVAVFMSLGFVAGAVDPPGIANVASVLGGDVAFGTRYAIHPQFAVGFQIGLTGLVEGIAPAGPLVFSTYGAVVFNFYSS